MKIIWMSLFLVGTNVALFACRQGDPQDPKTPVNSPVPEIDRPHDPLGDAGRSGAGADGRGAVHARAPEHQTAPR